MNKPRFRLLLLMLGTLTVLLLLLLLSRSGHRQSADNLRMPSAGASSPGSGDSGGARRARPFHSANSPAASRATPEQIVAAKLKKFARARRDVMHAMAKQKGVAVPAVIEHFFDAVESGDWTEIKATFDALNGGEPNAGFGSARMPEVTALWAAIIDTYGVAEQVHLWPAQKLLDYGNDVLGSLRPGMVYVGGTDEGRWIPTLMNETSDGERRIVITQNGLADGTYAEYLRFLYGDRFNTLSSADSDLAFQDYMKDAQKRFQHDQQFPDEPKQVRDNEQIKIVDGKTQVSGIVAVMDINERLLRMLMDKNPELSFALQESFPLKGTYEGAAPIGPIMELRAEDQSSFTQERAAESVNYWRTVAAQLRASADEANGENPLKSYSKLATGQANLFAERGLAESAEQTYRIALDLVPSNVDAVTGLAGLMERNGRAQDARNLVDQFARDFPKQADNVKRFRRSGFIFVQ